MSPYMQSAFDDFIDGTELDLNDYDDDIKWLVKKAFIEGARTAGEYAQMAIEQELG